MLSRRVRDETMLDLCRKLVFQDVRQDALVRSKHKELGLVSPHKSLLHAAPGVGLPIGNLSSQFFANVYLDGLDQMVKRKLGVKHYVRYVDDMVLLNESPSVLLAAADAIRQHLAGIGMTLAERKTFVAPVEKGIDFVGHVIRRHTATPCAGWRARSGLNSPSAAIAIWAYRVTLAVGGRPSSFAAWRSGAASASPKT